MNNSKQSKYKNFDGISSYQCPQKCLANCGNARQPSVQRFNGTINCYSRSDSASMLSSCNRYRENQNLVKSTKTRPNTEFYQNCSLNTCNEFENICCNMYQKNYHNPNNYGSRNNYYNCTPPNYTNEICNLYCTGHCSPPDGGTSSRCVDDDESVIPGLLDREFLLLHRNIPGLRRQGVDTNSFRQYFYPDGGWGWIICGTAFLAYLLTTGLQMSYSVLFYYAVQHIKNSNGLELLGSLSWSVSTIIAPILVTICRKKSTRLMAVVGGMVLPLGVLFTSFATEISQMIFSYGFIVGFGAAMVREASTVILGTYFKRRRHFVEMVVMSGEGIGIALLSVVIKEGVGKAGWRAGLQIVAAMLAVCFFMGLLYRPASLYHPHRRAIEHLKTQHKKLKNFRPNCKLKVKNKRHSYLFDLSILQSGTAKILLMISCVSALGIYAPMFLLTLHAMKEGSDIQELVLLQAFLGMSSSCGVVFAGLMKSRSFQFGNFIFNTKVVSQFLISLVALSILLLSFVMGYRGLCVLSWLYGIGFGGFRYSLKILTLERVKLKEFSIIWGLMRSTESLPIIISVPLTSFLNDYSLKYGRAGYYICAAAAAIAGIIIFFISNGTDSYWNRNQDPINNNHNELPTVATSLHLNYKNQPYNYLEPCENRYPLRSCASLNQIDASVACCGSGFRIQCTVPRCKSCFMNKNSNYSKLNKNDSLKRGPYSSGRLQRSLSYIQPKYCCDECSLQRNELSFQPFCDRTYNGTQIMCTCDIASNDYCSKSRSVPEGLCSAADNYNIKKTHEILYLPLKSKDNLLSECSKHIGAIKMPEQITGPRRTNLQRSCSFSRPTQYVEQITTSV